MPHSLKEIYEAASILHRLLNHNRGESRQRTPSPRPSIDKRTSRPGRAAEGRLPRIQRLWIMAAEVTLDLQILARLQTQTSDVAKLEEIQKSNANGSYLRFVAVLDDLPSALLSMDFAGAPNSNLAISSRRSFWLQRSHLLVTFHCLRSIFLHRYAELGLATLIGYTNDAAMLAFRKMEIAHEFLNVLTGIPLRLSSCKRRVLCEFNPISTFHAQISITISPLCATND